jgi:uncharacterized protein
MGRLLVLLLLVVAAVWLIRRALRAPGERERTGVPKSAGELVRCAHCAVLLPRAEARAADGALYCTEEHARLGPGKR